MSNKFSLTLPSLSFKVANPSSFSFTDVKRTPFFSIPRRIRWSVFWTSRKVNVMKHKKEMARITSTASSLIVPPQLLAWEVRSTHDCWRAYQSTPSALPGRAIEPHSVAVLAGDELVDHHHRLWNSVQNRTEQHPGGPLGIFGKKYFRPTYYKIEVGAWTALAPV